MSGGRTKFAAEGRDAVPAPKEGGGSVGGGPLGGVTGRLMPGQYEATVLVVDRQDGYVLWILETPAGLCHYEEVMWLPLALQPGMSCRIDVIPAGGFYWHREGGRMQARDADTRAPVAGFEGLWFDNMAEGYRALRAAGHHPCTTRVREVTYGGETYHPETCAVRQLHNPKAGTAAPG